jgi:cytochrome c oxidase subunit 2
MIAGALIVALAVLTIVGAVFAFQLEEPITSQARDIDLLYKITLAISLLVFFGVSAGIIWAIFRYRRTSDELPVQVHGSSTLEFTWTVIPILILVGLFVPSLALMIDLKSPSAEAEADVVVEVVGHQWWWEFRYPNEGIDIAPIPPSYQLENVPLGDDAFAPPTIVLPVDARVLFKVGSADVIHSFYLPQFLFKMHAVPGTINEFDVDLEEEGAYTGQCAQFCGLRHADMLFIIDVRSQAEYEQWLTETRQDQAAAQAAR